MSHSTTPRRGVLAAVAVILAGCTGSGDPEADSSDDSEPDEQPGPDDGTDDSDGGDDEPIDREEHVPDRDVEPDWDTAASFRKWLLFESPVDGGNRRFDYTESFPDDVDLSAVLPEFTELTIDDIDGHLVQGFTQVFLGSFDPDAIADDAEGDDDAEVVGEYEGYAVISEVMPSGQARTLAVGADAIVIGDDYEARIDARHGDGERLEDVDPEFTHLFQQLPHEGTITGEYDSPEGVLEIDEIYLWGVSSESPMADEMAWVFVMEHADDLTEDLLADLEDVSSDVSDSSIDGRTAILTGAPPEMSEAEPGESAD
ncbi:hypothetical protein [Natrarchaeobaculum sulfurireducens]|uniref:Uncharacterized protein n=1 Tax=Natrarchaeobaculum sulfurireducens TaxID=2044521 RepID=A0A346PB26_9EURY|nr:hypothetical protein [Natrarchaeobaculum sulfurireducens]AXR76721.1 hypothetical protein AArc1_0377 [Natrarchaeobaculum sulfurireducens]